MTTRGFAGAAAAIGLALVPGPAAALTACTVAATTVDFGVVTGSGVTATGTITTTCIGVGAYTVALSTGGALVYSNRRMASGGGILNYNLYIDAAHTQIWGDGTGRSFTVSDSIFIAGRSAVTVFGQVPAQPLPAPGSYTDTITVTVTF